MVWLKNVERCQKSGGDEMPSIKATNAADTDSLDIDEAAIVIG